jgi:hypothetical protein
MTGRKSRSELIWAAAAAVVGLGACISDAPQLDSVTPTTAARGTNIVLTGVRLCQQAGVGANGMCASAPAGTVDFSVDAPVQGAVQTWTDASIIVTVPSSAAVGANQVYVTSSGKSSNALDMTIQ